ncbi:MAG: hypothetical protein JWP78_3031 [Mucilaginibacter sp.]|nr:hypothetical protein [Mucilaginibacter sp.]
MILAGNPLCMFDKVKLKIPGGERLGDLYLASANTFKGGSC